MGKKILDMTKEDLEDGILRAQEIIDRQIELEKDFKKLSPETRALFDMHLMYERKKNPTKNLLSVEKLLISVKKIMNEIICNSRKRIQELESVDLK